MSEMFTPVVYVKQGCPFSLKLRLFLLESGQLDRVSLVEGQMPEDHQQIADHLAERIGKASFPSAEIAPGEYLADSDALVRHFADVAKVDPSNLPTFEAYAQHVFPGFQKLYREIMELRKA